LPLCAAISSVLIESLLVPIWTFCGAQSSDDQNLWMALGGDVKERTLLREDLKAHSKSDQGRRWRAGQGSAA
jgi:hypothetical protein